MTDYLLPRLLLVSSQVAMSILSFLVFVAGYFLVRRTFARSHNEALDDWAPVQKAIFTVLKLCCYVFVFATLATYMIRSTVQSNNSAAQFAFENWVW